MNQELYREFVDALYAYVELAEQFDPNFPEDEEARNVYASFELGTDCVYAIYEWHIPGCRCGCTPSSTGTAEYCITLEDLSRSHEELKANWEQIAEAKRAAQAAVEAELIRLQAEKEKQEALKVEEKERAEFKRLAEKFRGEF